MKNKKVVTIGGGTGTFPVVSALNQLPVDVTAVVAVSDSGGSSRRIRDEFGFQPVGDLRQSLAALANPDSQEWIRKLLLYRFAKGEGLEGHNLGNLILTALQDLTTSTSQALDVAGQIFQLSGQVLPVTEEKVDLKIIYEDGSEIIGEHHLDEATKTQKTILRVELTPPADINPMAKDALEQADLTIIGPGDLYASLMAVLAVRGVSKAINHSQSQLIYLPNLMTRFTQTYNMSVADHLTVIETALGRRIDHIILNNQSIDQSIIDFYAEANEHPVLDNLEDDTRVIRAPLLRTKVSQNVADSIERSLLRHSSLKLKPILEKLTL